MFFLFEGTKLREDHCHCNLGSRELPWHARAAGTQDVKLKVGFGRDHPGCANVLGAGTSLQAAKWIGFKTAQVECAYFYSEPAKDKRRKAYVVKNNVLAIVPAKG